MEIQSTYLIDLLLIAILFCIFVYLFALEKVVRYQALLIDSSGISGIVGVVGVHFHLINPDREPRVPDIIKAVRESKPGLSDDFELLSVRKIKTEWRFKCFKEKSE